MSPESPAASPISLSVASAAPGLAPVGEGERVHAVDALRGFALLGILMMNITAFGLPSEAYVNPMAPALEGYVGPFDGLTKGVWLGIHLLFDLKMMTIFSMLFGAGLVLLGGRAEARGTRSFAGVYYRRLLWLFVIGMLHAYFIWYGDILVAYALCGLLLYPLRRLRLAWLIGIGAVVMLIGLGIWSGLGFSLALFRDQTMQVQAIVDQGGTPSEEQAGMLKGWNETKQGLYPTAEEIVREVEQMRGPWWENIKHNAKETAFMQTGLFVLMTSWRVLGCMLVGMGLMKAGVFSAARSTRFYVVMALVGYGLGLPLVAWGARGLIEHRFDFIYIFQMGWHANYVGSVLVALGHVGALMLIIKSGVLSWITARLAAVGRMALTNYLMQSILCTFIFWGWGLGMFAKWALPQMVLVVLGVWIVQLAWSPWWLARFRFGPAEWLWRSLTYGKRQAMRAAAGGAVH